MTNEERAVIEAAEQCYKAYHEPEATSLKFAGAENRLMERVRAMLKSRKKYAVEDGARVAFVNLEGDVQRCCVGIETFGPHTTPKEWAERIAEALNRMEEK